MYKGVVGVVHPRRFFILICLISLLSGLIVDASGLNVKLVRVDFIVGVEARKIKVIFVNEGDAFNIISVSVNGRWYGEGAGYVHWRCYSMVPEEHRTTFIESGAKAAIVIDYPWEARQSIKIRVETDLGVWEVGTFVAGSRIISDEHWINLMFIFEVIAGVAIIVAIWKKA